MGSMDTNANYRLMKTQNGGVCFYVRGGKCRGVIGVNMDSYTNHYGEPVDRNEAIRMATEQGAISVGFTDFWGRYTEEPLE